MKGTATQNESATTVSSESLVRRLNDREADIIGRSELLIRGAAEVVKLAVEQGRDLLQARRAMKHGEWVPWMERSLHFSVRRAQEYMQLAYAAKVLGLKFFEDAKSVADAMRRLGLVPHASGTGKPGNTLSVPPLIRHLNWVAEWTTKERGSLDEMEPQQLENLRQHLRPAAELYEAVKAKLAGAGKEQ